MTKRAKKDKVTTHYAGGGPHPHKHALTPAEIAKLMLGWKLQPEEQHESNRG